MHLFILRLASPGRLCPTKPGFRMTYVSRSRCCIRQANVIVADHGDKSEFRRARAQAGSMATCAIASQTDDSVTNHSARCDGFSPATTHASPCAPEYPAFNSLIAFLGPFIAVTLNCFPRCRLYEMKNSSTWESSVLLTSSMEVMSSC